MTAYYNEIDPKAAAWLRELIKKGLMDKYCGECKHFDRENESINGNAYCNYRNVETDCDWLACKLFEEYKESEE